MPKRSPDAAQTDIWDLDGCCFRSVACCAALGLIADAGGEATGELNRERDGAREPSLLAPAICSYPRTPLYWPPRKVYLCMVCRQGSGKVDFAFA